MLVLSGKPVIVFYHAFCWDGLGAAYIVKRSIGDCTCIPINYGKHSITSLRDLVGSVCKKALVDSDIIFVDFCLPYDLMVALNNLTSGRMFVLDHHLTQYPILKKLSEETSVQVFYDSHESGTSLAAIVFNGGRMEPLFKYIKDRDLWNFNYEETQSVNAFISEYSRKDVSVIDQLLNIPIEEMVEKGNLLLKYKNSLVDELSSKAVKIKLLGIEILYVMCIAAIASDVGNAMAEVSPSKTSVCVYNIKGGISLSFRSIGVDCTPLAKHFGGGGHAQACGASVDLDTLNLILSGRLGEGDIVLNKLPIAVGGSSDRVTIGDFKNAKAF